MFKTFLRRCFILSKRLFKKPGFVIILLFIPLLVICMNIMAGSGDSGVITIALAKEDKNDKIACEIIDKLTTENSLIRFTVCENKKEAALLVESGKADAAWIFAQNLSQKIEKFSNHTHQNNAFVAVIQREESISLRLSHEKLSQVLYPYVSRALYREAVCDIINTADFSQAELDAYYNAINAEGDELFDFIYSNDSAEVTKKNETNLFLSPVKGLFAIMILLSGIAISMFYMQDEKIGVFDRLPRSEGFSFALIYHSVAIFMVGAAVFIALAITGFSTKWYYELPILVLYCLTVIGFCMNLRMIIRDLRLFASIAPLLIIITAVLCPIFITAPEIKAVQLLLPTYYYVSAFTNKFFILYTAVYSAILFTLAFILHSLRLKRIK